MKRHARDSTGLRSCLLGPHAATPSSASTAQSGRQVWTHQYGTPEDYALAVAVDPRRGLVIAGSTRGTLDDRSHGNLDAYALRLVEPANQ
jgi:hypothetical protein